MSKRKPKEGDINWANLPEEGRKLNGYHPTDMKELTYARLIDGLREIDNAKLFPYKQNRTCTNLDELRKKL